jgi:hypothetical protein
MKRVYIFLTVILLGLFSVQGAKAQEQEIQQLILNLEKLNQLRSILDQMYKGYQIVSKGYNTIKDLSEGNFNLHKVFLDKLLEVSPVVKQYKRVADIIACQRALIKEYKAALLRFEELNVFNKDDMEYLERVYKSLFDRSLQNLDELLMVITANQLRMNDAERLNAIDRIYTDMQDKLQFLRHFNDKTSLLAAQKKQELNDTRSLRRMYGVEN